MISSSSDSRWVFHSSTDFKIHFPFYISGAICQATEYPPWYGSKACLAVGSVSGVMWCILGLSGYMLWVLSKFMNYDITYNIFTIGLQNAGHFFLIVWSDGWLKMRDFLTDWHSKRSDAPLRQPQSLVDQSGYLFWVWLGVVFTGGEIVHVVCLCIYFLNCLTRSCRSISWAPTSYLSY